MKAVEKKTKQKKNSVTKTRKKKRKYCVWEDGKEKVFKYSYLLIISKLLCKRKNLFFIKIIYVKCKKNAKTRTWWWQQRYCCWYIQYKYIYTYIVIMKILSGLKKSKEKKRLSKKYKQQKVIDFTRIQLWLWIYTDIHMNVYVCMCKYKYIWYSCVNVCTVIQLKI